MRGVDDAGVAPGKCFAASGHYGANPSCHGIVRVRGQKIKVAVQRISLQSRDVCVLRIEIADRLRADRGYLIARNRWRWGIGCALQEEKWRLNFGRIPRHLAAFGRFVDAQTNPVKHFAKRQSTCSHHFGKRLRVGPIRPLFPRSYRAGRGVEGNQHALFGLYQR